MRRVQLTDELKRRLKPALWGGAAKPVYQEIEQGQSGLYVTPDNNLLLVLRQEGRELVVVAAVGRDLYRSRQAIIDFARANGAHAIRWHTRDPKHLAKGTAGLPVKLIDRRPRLLGRDEYVFKLEVF